MTIAPPELGFLWLELTGKCQLECGHCYADSGPTGTHGSMGYDDWIRAIDQAAALGVSTVQMIGGEPTLYPGLPGLIAHALATDVEVEVYTNLVHVTPAMWELFGQPGVRLATSYYTDNPVEHRQITGRNTLHRTLANIGQAVAHGDTAPGRADRRRRRSARRAGPGPARRTRRRQRGRRPDAPPRAACARRL